MNAEGGRSGWEFLDGVAIADVAFRAYGPDLDTLFRNAAEATVEVMVDELSSVEAQVRREVALSEDDLEMLLFDFLQELIYYKDAEELLLRPERVTVTEQDGGYRLSATLAGEPLDRKRHPLNADVKAVTMHRFGIRETAGGYEADVVVDI